MKLHNWFALAFGLVLGQACLLFKPAVVEGARGELSVASLGFAPSFTGKSQAKVQRLKDSYRPDKLMVRNDAGTYDRVRAIWPRWETVNSWPIQVYSDARGEWVQP